MRGHTRTDRRHNQRPIVTMLRSLIPIRELPNLLPRGRNGAKLALSTIWRWRLKGRRGRKLPVTVISGVAYVHEDDLQAFLAPERQTTATQITDHPRRQDAQRQEAVEGILAQEFGV